MGLTKTEFFTERQNKTAMLLKALGHPARVAIIEHLLKVKSCVCGDIVSELPLAQPTVSQHLKELKSAGIIKGSVEGTSVCYCLDEKAFESLSAYFSHALTDLQNKNSTCC
ncbi:winged helix-turn-helix transcriptional regulator [Pontibacter sp. JH31]|uniref:Winged helix-turn-helix transcriptional regulator n=1 Tax=Pontibacter aquaedesilientis TaxID=2766980 RepID=A0ABR7XFP6_9BACT|nr:metalloregulator ArsR/SmtB family transcription factor [Pontibacter aquaedesilientis]MBD1397097.1 winged helix-turn-helix transcriptional regulator [Pontibacter aquaedesilientis]